MKTSIIISTYNTPHLLQKVIWGYENQNDSNFDIIIADDGSSGENLAANKKIINSANLSVEHVWHPDAGFQKCRILNKAIHAAPGEYLVFTDGDCIPHPDFVRSHKSNARKKQFLSGGHSKISAKLSKKITQESIISGDCFRLAWLLNKEPFNFRSWFKIGCKTWKIDPLINRFTTVKRTFNGGNSSCFKNDAIAVNGFNEQMHYGGEDREFGYRLENFGVQPAGFRYSAPCLHLYHTREYVQTKRMAENKIIMKETKSTGRIKTENGLIKL